MLDWWIDAPERAGWNVPAVLKAILIPWFLIGILFVMMDDLQKNVPGLVLLLLTAPAILGMLWMALGMTLSILDWFVRIGSKIAGRFHG